MIAVLFQWHSPVISMAFTYFLSLPLCFLSFLIAAPAYILVEANFASCLLYFLQGCEPSRVSFIGWFARSTLRSCCTAFRNFITHKVYFLHYWLLWVKGEGGVYIIENITWICCIVYKLLRPMMFYSYRFSSVTERFFIELNVRRIDSHSLALRSETLSIINGMRYLKLGVWYAKTSPVFYSFKFSIFVFVDRILVRMKGTTGPNCLKNYVHDWCCGLLRCTQPPMLLFMYTGSRTCAAIICIIIRSYCLYKNTKNICDLFIFSSAN